ncbi:MAG: MaoC family dehydratase N-terminal domain-containing protein [Sphingopyxis sp.]
MPKSSKSDWQDWIGRSETRTDLVTAGLVKRLCATFSVGLSHSQASAAVNGDVPQGAAPQGVHWCLCLPDAATAELGEDGHPRRDIEDAFLPPISLPRSQPSGKGQTGTRRMWASSKLAFHAPIAVGAAVTRTSTITAIAEKAGSSGPLVFVTLRHETRADGALAVEEEQLLVYRGAADVSAAFARNTPPLPRAQSHVPLHALKGRGLDEDWPHVRTLTPGETMLFRYSALTFNAHRIHYDALYAQGVEGYRALVVHGPLTATLLIDFAREISGGAPLKSFAFRAAAPLFCGEPMTLVARQEGAEMTMAALGPAGVAAIEASAVVGV